MRTDTFELVWNKRPTRSASTILQFPSKTALVIGAEREGLDQQELDRLDHVVEIPVYGQPYSYNVATATTMAVYEYCRQFRAGFQFVMERMSESQHLATESAQPRELRNRKWQLTSFGCARTLTARNQLDKPIALESEALRTFP